MNGKPLTQVTMQQENPSNITMKGIRDGLLINIGAGEWSDLVAELLQQVEARENFFHGAKVALDVGERVIGAAEMGSFRDKLSDKDVTLWAVLSTDTHTEETARTLGLATTLATPKPDPAPLDTRLAGESALLVQRTLRSGYQISFHGHVTVIGDVNPGAEIIAGGNVVVWGKLRGVVHAGADGDDNAVVCALDLMPTQLRINDKIAITPQRKGKAQPEIARIRDGQVVAESWDYSP